MHEHDPLSRRGFVGGIAAAVGALGLTPGLDLVAQGTAQGVAKVAAKPPIDPLDAMAKLSANENPYGPPPSVMKAMTHAFKYANRYFYPDGNLTAEIARHHEVKPENIMLAAGSGEILDVAATALLLDGTRKVLGVEPTYSQVFGHATSIKCDAIKLPLLPDYTLDMPALIRTANERSAEIGFIYLCNPNNPTGLIVPKAQVQQLLDGIPKEMPVLIDEAYHHFVDSPDYATSVPYVIEGRPVIVTRTFSKIAALAGMRLGYAVASPEFIKRMRPWTTGGINALAKWGGVAALKDTASQAHVKKVTMALRQRTTDQLTKLGYDVIPSEANFFMVHVRQPVVPVIEAFKKKNVLVGRPFPPMNEHLRVSVGTPEEMRRFVVAFKAIMAESKA